MKHSGARNHLGTTTTQRYVDTGSSKKLKNKKLKMSVGKANYQDWIASSVPP